MIEENGKANLYVVPEEKMKEYRKEAIKELYGIDKDDYSKIIKTMDFLEKMEGVKIEESNKKLEAAKQIKAKVNGLVKQAIGNTSTGIKKYTLK